MSSEGSTKGLASCYSFPVKPYEGLERRRSVLSGIYIYIWMGEVLGCMNTAVQNLWEELNLVKASLVSMSYLL